MAEVFSYNLDQVFGSPAMDGSDPDFQLTPSPLSPVGIVALDRRDFSNQDARVSGALDPHTSERMTVKESLYHTLHDRYREIDKEISTHYKTFIGRSRVQLSALGYTVSDLSYEGRMVQIIERGIEMGQFSATSGRKEEKELFKIYKQYEKQADAIDFKLSQAYKVGAVYLNFPSSGVTDNYDSEFRKKETPARRMLRRQLEIAGYLARLDFLAFTPRIFRTRLVLGVFNAFLLSGTFSGGVPPLQKDFQSMAATSQALTSQVESQFNNLISGVQGGKAASNVLTRFGISVGDQAQMVEAAGKDVNVLRLPPYYIIGDLLRSNGSINGLGVNTNDDLATTQRKADAFFGRKGLVPTFLNDSYAVLPNLFSVEGAKPFNYDDPKASEITLPSSSDKVLEVLIMQFSKGIKAEELKKPEAKADRTKSSQQYGIMLKGMVNNAEYSKRLESFLNKYWGLYDQEGKLRTIVATENDLARSNTLFLEASQKIKLLSAEELGRLIELGIDQ
jgi:hypothetical protein